MRTSFWRHSYMERYRNNKEYSKNKRYTDECYMTWCYNRQEQKYSALLQEPLRYMFFWLANHPDWQ